MYVHISFRYFMLIAQVTEVVMYTVEFITHGMISFTEYATKNINMFLCMLINIFALK